MKEFDIDFDDTLAQAEIKWFAIFDTILADQTMNETSKGEACQSLVTVMNFELESARDKFERK